jgi:hypothetical protein
MFLWLTDFFCPQFVLAWPMTRDTSQLSVSDTNTSSLENLAHKLNGLTPLLLVCALALFIGIPFGLYGPWGDFLLLSSVGALYVSILLALLHIFSFRCELSLKGWPLGLVDLGNGPMLALFAQSESQRCDKGKCGCAERRQVSCFAPKINSASKRKSCAGLPPQSRTRRPLVSLQIRYKPSGISSKRYLRMNIDPYTGLLSSSPVHLRYWLVSKLFDGLRTKQSHRQVHQTEGSAQADEFDRARPQSTAQQAPEIPPRPEPSTRHWSDVLGVPTSAPQKEVKDAYRRLMSKYHPGQVGEPW